MDTGEVNNPTIGELLDVYSQGIIGTIEFRSWLSKLYPDFDEVRDAELDEQIRARAQDMIDFAQRQRDLAFRSHPDDN